MVISRRRHFGNRFRLWLQYEPRTPRIGTLLELLSQIKLLKIAVLLTRTQEQIAFASENRNCRAEQQG